MKLNIVGSVREVTSRTANNGAVFCDVLLELPTFGDRDPDLLLVSTSKSSADAARRLVRGQRVYVDARLSSRPPAGERKFWSTDVYAFAIEPIGFGMVPSGNGYDGF